MSRPLIVSYMGMQAYLPLWHHMRERNKAQPWQGDVLLLVEHPPVYTLGVSGGQEHLKEPTDIDIVQTDRGGSITYHGPGQLMIYPMIDLRNSAVSIKNWVSTLENCMIAWLQTFISGLHTIEDKRGVFVHNEKLISIGLRIANGRSYHGLCVNIDCSLTAFDNINPCGYPDLKMTQWKAHNAVPEDWYSALENAFCTFFGYNGIIRELDSVRITPECKITWPRKTS